MTTETRVWQISVPLIKSNVGRLYVSNGRFLFVVDDRDAEAARDHLNAGVRALKDALAALADFGKHSELCVEYDDGTCSCGYEDECRRLEAAVKQAES